LAVRSLVSATPVPLISDLISPVSNEIALVSGPRAFLVA
jgi:hypothetical protein